MEFFQYGSFFFGGLVIFCVVPNGFPTCYPSSQCVLQHVPNSSSLDPLSFSLNFYSCNLYNNQLEGEDYNISILELSKACFLFFNNFFNASLLKIEACFITTPLGHPPLELIHMEVDPWPNKMGLWKKRYFWECLREHLGNLRGTLWEYIGE